MVFGKTQDSISFPIDPTSNPFAAKKPEDTCVALSRCFPNWGTDPATKIWTDVLGAGAHDPAFPKLK